MFKSHLSGYKMQNKREYYGKYLHSKYCIRQALSGQHFINITNDYIKARRIVWHILDAGAVIQAGHRFGGLPQWTSLPDFLVKFKPCNVYKQYYEDESKGNRKSKDITIKNIWIDFLTSLSIFPQTVFFNGYVPLFAVALWLAFIFGRMFIIIINSMNLPWLQHNHLRLV